MAEIRGRRRPEPPSDEDTRPLLPSILRAPSSDSSSEKKKTSFAPGTVFYCRHLRYRRAKLRTVAMGILLACVVGTSFWVMYGVMEERQGEILSEILAGGTGGEQAGRGQVRPGALGSFQNVAETKEKKARVKLPSSTDDFDVCQFRTYPSNRLYGLPSSNQPPFLTNVPYIRGQYPFILNPTIDNKQTPTATKLCINTTSWENTLDNQGKQRWPFTDGHNPSIVSLHSTPHNDGHVRLNHDNLHPLTKAKELSKLNLDNLFMAITVFGSGQCKFGLTEEDIQTYRFSTHEEVPNGKRAIISIHSSFTSDNPFELLVQTTLLLELDGKYGTTRKALQVQKQEAGRSGYKRIHQEFDDPRFFFHRGNLWVLYRNGPLFGYNDQIHNPVHFEEAPDGFVAFVKASETVRVCCGRNIALISEERDGKEMWSENPTLKALTWVDPVTVKDVKLGDVEGRLGRRLDDFKSPSSNHFHTHNQHRRLKSSTPKSNIHGTNGYMLPLSSGELLGIAHFHRPEHRQSSEYALHGHHYTHVFFTIAKQQPIGNGNESTYKLRRISNEFLFQAQYSPLDSDEKYQDGDIIQFASGLDLVGNDVDGTLIVSYGINDCEGAVFTVDMERVQSLLLEVEEGKEVVGLMANYP